MRFPECKKPTLWHPWKFAARPFSASVSCVCCCPSGASDVGGARVLSGCREVVSGWTSQGLGGARARQAARRVGRVEGQPHGTLTLTPNASLQARHARTVRSPVSARKLVLSNDVLEVALRWSLPDAPYSPSHHIKKKKIKITTFSMDSGCSFQSPEAHLRIISAPEITQPFLAAFNVCNPSPTERSAQHAVGFPD